MKRFAGKISLIVALTLVGALYALVTVFPGLIGQ